MIDDPNDSLKSLALKLFSITPHSASCERSFSMLGFLYEKRRQCLNLLTIEMIAKIRYYLMSDVRNDLNHLKKEETESELQILIQECGFFNEEEDDDDLNDEYYDGCYYNNDNELPSHEVYVLIVNDMIDLNNSIFTGDVETEVMDNNGSDDNDEILYDEELDCDTISKILAPPNM